jgi:hypothetical protein
MLRPWDRVSVGAKKLSDRLGIIRNFIWLFTVLAGAAVASFLALPNHPVLRAIIVIGSAILAGVGIGYLVGQSIEHRRAGSLGYRILQYHIDYSFNDADPRKHKHTVSIELLALRAGVGIYEGRYGWSGTGNDAGPRIVSGNARLIMAPPAPVTGWSRYYVILDRPLQRGGRAKFKFEHDLFDATGTFIPFLAKNLEQKIANNLTLRVKFPQKLPVPGSIVSCTRPTNPSDNVTLHEDEVKADTHNKLVEVVFNRPKVGRRYSLEWSWPEYLAYCTKRGSS